MSEVDCDIVELGNLPEEYQEGARRFVIASWVADYRRAAPKGLDGEVYKTRQRQLVQHILPRSKVLVATMPGAPDIFLGWSVKGPACVHYVYVKASWRRGGVATKLVGRPDFHTHTTVLTYAREWLTRLGSTYDPYLLMKGINP